MAAGLGSILAVVALAVFVAFGGGGDASGDHGMGRDARPTVVSDSRTVTVEVVDDDYRPRTLAVRVGTTVTWNFTGKRPHTVTDERGSFDSGVVERGGAFSQRFDKAGTFFYYCTLHHAMQGTVTVTP